MVESFFVFGFYFLFKGYSLFDIWFHGVDGEGIGLYLGFIKINDKLPAQLIPSYAAFFSVTGLGAGTSPGF